MSPTPLALTAYTLTNALGHGIAASLSALCGCRSGLRPCDFEDVDFETWIGRVDGLESDPIVGPLRHYDCRNNRLARMALAQDGFERAVADAARRVGVSRVGIFVGTSTSGVRETEKAYAELRAEDGGLPSGYRYDSTHSLSSVAMYVRSHLGLEGLALVISTACSSSAKVFATAHRHLSAGICDAAVVGGVDTLCLMTLYGFRALGLVSSQPCKPWDAERDGISIGEGAGFALLEKDLTQQHRVQLLGYGESSDGYHMSSPHPQGVGAALALEQALQRAGIQSSQVDYVNLHGTGTRANDTAEDLAMARVMGRCTPCSSTKGWTGHTLGAAGITEAILSCLCIESSVVPGSMNTTNLDPELTASVRLDNEARTVNVAVSNSFGFGGSNCSLVLGKAR